MCRYWQSSARSVLVRRCRTLGRAGPCCASVAARVTAPAVCYSKPPSGWAIMPTATKAVEDLFAKISREAAAPSDSNPSGTAAAAAPTKTQVRPNRALHHTHTQLARRTQRQQARPLSRRTGLIARASRPPPQPPRRTTARGSESCGQEQHGARQFGTTDVLPSTDAGTARAAATAPAGSSGARTSPGIAVTGDPFSRD